MWCLTKEDDDNIVVLESFMTRPDMAKLIELGVRGDDVSELMEFGHTNIGEYTYHLSYEDGPQIPLYDATAYAIKIDEKNWVSIDEYDRFFETNFQKCTMFRKIGEAIKALKIVRESYPNAKMVTDFTVTYREMNTMDQDRAITEEALRKLSDKEIDALKKHFGVK